MCPGGGASGEGVGGAGTTPVILHMDEEATPAQVGAISYPLTACVSSLQAHYTLYM